MPQLLVGPFRRVSAAPPGFLNFWLTGDFLLDSLDSILKNPDKWGKSDAGKGKTAVVEYFQLNIAKRPHIGHLRSAVIGDVIKRMLLQFGYNAVSDTHVGDWGTQFGILLHAYKEELKIDPNFEEAAKKEPFEKLQELYVRAHKAVGVYVSAEDADLDVEEHYQSLVSYGREEFSKLEHGDEENRKIWQWMVDISMEKLQETARRLQLLPFEEHRGESAYEEMMGEVVKKAHKRGAQIREGAVIFDLSSEGLDEAVLVKSDGASTYLLRDLATIQYRKAKWDFWKNLYVVDVRQEHSFSAGVPCR